MDERLEQTQTQETTQTDNIDQFNMEMYDQLKNNTVSKEKYQKLENKYKDLFNSYANGEQLAAADTPVVEKDLNELRKKVSGSQLSLDGWKAALELRTELIKRGEQDPFLPVGKKILHTEEDIAAANRVAEGIQHCIEYAEGDPEIFATELQRITVDTAPRKNNGRR